MEQCKWFESKQALARELTNSVKEKYRSTEVKKKKLVWLELTGCSGNIISLLNGDNPDLEYMLTSMVTLVYENSLMSPEGERAIEQLIHVEDEEFILVIEGAIATKNDGMYQVIGRYRGEPLTALRAAQVLGKRATHVIAMGTCASYGGISAASPNPSACVPVKSVINRRVIQVPGCPCHPDWLLGTLAALILYDSIDLDNEKRPLMFYGTTIHDRCTRRSFFDDRVFATKLGEETCMFRLGCRGPRTRTDCPVRQWNSYVSWPVEDNTPCIGCANSRFPDTPFIDFDLTRDVRE